MAADDGPRWDARYADQSVGTPAPPDAVVTAGLLDLIPTSGRALDVACGAGSQAAWLASRGLDVVALDASPVAIELTRRTLHAVGGEGRLTTRVVDLDAGIPDDLGDFDVIVCQRFRVPALYGEFVDRLRPGGIAVVTVLSQAGADQPGPFHAPPGELLAAFTRPHVELLAHTESAGQASVILRK